MVERKLSSPARWLFIFAGISAAFVTGVRAILGGAGDLALLNQALSEDGLIGVVRVNWHALTAIFASLSIALFVAAGTSREAARAIGILAGTSFGATCASFLVVSAQVTGSPFTWFPWVPLGVTAALSFAAAARA